jgi:stage III sporulation protein AD
MELYWKGIGAVLVTVILSLSLSKHGKETGLLLVLAVGCMVGCAAMGYLKPVIDFVHQLQNLGQLDSSMLSILLKAVGVGLIGEIATLVCADAGNASLGKTLQLLTTSVILWLSLPLMTQLLELLEQLLGDL